MSADWSSPATASVPPSSSPRISRAVRSCAWRSFRAARAPAGSAGA